MKQELEQLLVLQDRDRKVRTMQAELAAAPLERKQLEQRLATAGARFDAVKQRGRELEVERKRLEVEANAKRESIARFKVQQFQTKKNEEFQALTNEIARFESDIEKIEDRELELMESAEALKSDIKAADEGARLAETQVRTQIIDLETKVTSIKKRLDELGTERAGLASGIDEDVRDLYERLFRSKGDAAVVPLKGEICGGCHMKVTTQTAVRVKGGNELVSCEQCGRILYYDE